MNLMIIDDDLQIREGISKGIKWDTIGIDKVEAFPDGVDALKAFHKFQPDMIICDVCMPEMNGLEFLREAKAINPQIRFVLISGYNDFAYVQQAIKLGATDYELKPVKAKDLINKIISMRNDILQEQNAFNQQIEYQKEYKSNMFRRILIGEITDYSIKKSFFEKHYDLERFNDFVMMIVDKNLEMTYMMNEEIKKFLIDKLEDVFENEVILYDMNERYVILVQTINSTLYMQNKIVELRRIFNMIAKNYEKIDFTAVVSEGHSLKIINEVYARLLRVLNYKFYLGSGQCWGESFQPVMKEVSIDIYSLTKDLIRKIEMEEEYIETFSQMEVYWKSCCDIEPKETQTSIVGILFDLFGDYKQEISLEEVARDIFQMQYLEEVLEEFKKIVNMIVMKKRTDKEQVYSHAVRLAIDYIKQHYLEQITIEQVAWEVNKSPNYLSSIFKKEVGSSFSIYINQLRINKSKELLKNTMLPLSDIAVQSGYTDYAYFVSVFKKLEGCTPSSLRKNQV